MSIQHLRANLSGEVRHVDARHGIVSEQPDTAARRRLFQGLAQPERRHRTSVPARIDKDFATVHSHGIHRCPPGDYRERCRAAIWPAMLWNTWVRLEESLTS